MDITLQPMVASSSEGGNPLADVDVLATAVLPWTKSGRLDEAAFRREVRQLASKLTRALYIFGTAGEGYAVTDRQFRDIAKLFHEEALACEATPMLGVISLSLGTIIERIEIGRELGFTQFQISLPAWGALDDRELDRFFAETCGQFPDRAFLHYNLPRARRVLGAAEYKRLKAAHPNLAAVKMGTEDPAAIASLLTLSPSLRFFFTEFGYAIGREIAPCGLLISQAAVNFLRAREFVAGTAARRRELLVDLRAMEDALCRLAAGRFHMDGAFDKLIYALHDPSFPLELLPPYAGPGPDDLAHWRRSLPPHWQPADLK